MHHSDSSVLIKRHTTQLSEDFYYFSIKSVIFNKPALLTKGLGFMSRLNDRNGEKIWKVSPMHLQAHKQTCYCLDALLGALQAHRSYSDP